MPIFRKYLKPDINENKNKTDRTPFTDDHLT